MARSGANQCPCNVGSWGAGLIILTLSSSHFDPNRIRRAAAGRERFFRTSSDQSKSSHLTFWGYASLALPIHRAIDELDPKPAVSGTLPLCARSDTPYSGRGIGDASAGGRRRISLLVLWCARVSSLRFGCAKASNALVVERFGGVAGRKFRRLLTRPSHPSNCLPAPVGALPYQFAAASSGIIPIPANIPACWHAYFNAFLSPCYRRAECLSRLVAFLSLAILPLRMARQGEMVGFLFSSNCGGHSVANCGCVASVGS
jgi:hypothetical protein